MKRTHVTCAFCSREEKREAFGKTFCSGCGHRADCRQKDCDCRICRRRETRTEQRKGVAA